MSMGANIVTLPHLAEVRDGCRSWVGAGGAGGACQKMRRQFMTSVHTDLFR